MDVHVWTIPISISQPVGREHILISIILPTCIFIICAADVFTPIIKS